MLHVRRVKLNPSTAEISELPTYFTLGDCLEEVPIMGPSSVHYSYTRIVLFLLV